MKYYTTALVDKDLKTLFTRMQETVMGISSKYHVVSANCSSMETEGGYIGNVAIVLIDGE